MMIVTLLMFGIGLGAVYVVLRVSTEESPTCELIRKMGMVLAALCITLGILMPLILPQYEVWQQNKKGEAELARAEQNRKIAIQEAKAKEEAAHSLANAEIIRARGIAEANKIIGDSLENNEAYIHYLWIEALKESNSDIIYIPTEAGIPITESQRLAKVRESAGE